MKQEPQGQCPICQKSFYPFPMGEKQGYIFVACKICGSVMTSPMVTENDLRVFFDATQPVAQHLPSPQHEINLIKYRISKVTDSYAGKRFLDINNRQGYAVAAARELGFESCRGISPYSFFTSFAQEAYGRQDFRHMSAAEYATLDFPADFIYANQAFCGQPSLEKFTAALARILAPDGVAYIEEPNGNSMWLPGKFTRWQMVEPPLSFVYMSYEGIKALLKRHGLHIAHRYFTFSPYMRLKVVKKA